jgi:hypothetical protein
LNPISKLVWDIEELEFGACLEFGYWSLGFMRLNLMLTYKVSKV